MTEEELEKLYPKWNCSLCGDWFHMPYKFCKCDCPEVIHKTKSWYNLTHWVKPNETKCGKHGVSRWRWEYVTCKECLKWR